MPEHPAVLRAVRGTSMGLQSLSGARQVRMGQRFEHSANLEVTGPTGRPMVVNLTDDVCCPLQVMLDEASQAGVERAWRPGTVVQVETEGAGRVQMQTPFTGPLDPTPAVAMTQPWLERSWFCSEDGRLFGRPALRRALDGEVDALMGLGAGLTPAGDDVLVAWIAWHRAVTGSAEQFEHLDDASVGATTRTSSSLLAAALAGETGRAVNTMLGALRSHDMALLQQSVDRLAQHGSSSGADALYGLHALWTRPSALPLDGRRPAREVSR